MRLLYIIAVLFSTIAMASGQKVQSNISTVKEVFYSDFASAYKDRKNPQAVYGIINKYDWINPSILNVEASKELTLETDPNITVKILRKIKQKTDRQDFLLWDAQQRIAKKTLHNKDLPHAFISANLTVSEEKLVMSRYKKIITQDDIKKRIYNLSWMDGRKNIEVLKQCLSQEKRKAIDNILSTSAKVNNNGLKSNEYRLYLHVKGLLKEERYGEAEKIILNMDVSEQQKLHADMWWKLRHILARELLKKKKYKEAYEIAKHHGSMDPSALTDAEWLAGWISLRFLNKPFSAVFHFHQVFDNALMSDTKAKAAYWLWRAYNKDNRHVEAQKWLDVASSYQGFFYGQVALLHQGKKIDPFAIGNTNKELDSNAMKHASVGVAFYKKGMHEIGKKFILASSEYKMNYETASSIANMVSKLHDVELDVLLGKKIANNQNINLENAYPTDLRIKGLRPSLYYGIIRQESNFNCKAVSPVGAYGLMQLMPKTAAMLSKKLGIPSRSYKYNINSNIASGSAYLDMLMDDLNHSYIGAIGSYNAGKANVQKWMVHNGNLNDLKTIEQAIDWIESIPFGETRFYVKKVIANVIIYDYLLNKRYGVKPKTSPKSYLS